MIIPEVKSGLIICLMRKYNRMRIKKWILLSLSYKNNNRKKTNLNLKKKEEGLKKLKLKMRNNYKMMLIWTLT